MIDRKHFFQTARQLLFGGSLTQDQVDGMEAILYEWDIRQLPRLEWLAYMLATTQWETASTMQPIREYGRGKGRKYGRKDAATGHAYYGRGFVQLTWADNYKRAGREIGQDFYRNPDLVMELKHATKILFDGMIDGWFTGKKLSDYIRSAKVDYVGARRIINGTDKARQIAGIAKKFRAALKDVPAEVEIEDTPVPENRPLNPNVVGGVTVAGGGGAVVATEVLASDWTMWVMGGSAIAAVAVGGFLIWKYRKDL